MRSLAPLTFGLLDGGGLVHLRALIAERLPQEELRAVLSGLLSLLRDLSPEERAALLRLGDNPRLRALLPTLIELLRFVGGDRADPTSARGPLLDATRRLLQSCAGGELFTALDLSLRAPELPRALTALGEVIALPMSQQILASDLPGALNRAGFTALMCNLTAALIRPQFSLRADLIEPLAGVDLLPLGEPPLSTLMDALDALLSPQRPLLPAVRDLVCCDLYGVAECAQLSARARPLPGDPVFVWSLYDLLVSRTLDTGALLHTLATAAADPEIAQALAPVGRVLRQLGADPALRRALTALLNVALEPAVARGVLPELVRLLEVGALDELLALVGVLSRGCGPGDPTEPAP